MEMSSWWHQLSTERMRYQLSQESTPDLAIVLELHVPAGVDPTVLESDTLESAKPSTSSSKQCTGMQMKHSVVTYIPPTGPAAAVASHQGTEEGGSLVSKISVIWQVFSAIKAKVSLSSGPKSLMAGAVHAGVTNQLQNW